MPNGLAFGAPSAPPQMTPDGVPVHVIHVEGKAAKPATWPMYLGAAAAAALMMAPQKYGKPALLTIGILGYLWLSGKWPAEAAEAAPAGGEGVPEGFYGGGSFTGSGAGR